MARRMCKVVIHGAIAQGQCFVHRLPLKGIERVFADIILAEYSKDELRYFHDLILLVMLDATKGIPLDDI